MNVFSADFPYWKAAVAELDRACMLVRGYKVNSGDLLEKGHVAQLNVIATDEVEAHAWAKVSGEPFELR